MSEPQKIVHHSEAVEFDKVVNKILALFKQCRGEGKTMYDTAHATARLFYELAKETRDINKSLGLELQKKEKRIKELENLTKQKSLL